jgi:hypothetical protein
MGIPCHITDRFPEGRLRGSLEGKVFVRLGKMLGKAEIEKSQDERECKNAQEISVSKKHGRKRLSDGFFSFIFYCYLGNRHLLPPKKAPDEIRKSTQALWEIIRCRESGD